MEGRIVVKTETLVSQSEEVSKQILNTEKAFNELKSLVSSTSSYWIGEAGEAHRTNYMNRQSEVETAIRRLRSIFVCGTTWNRCFTVSSFMASVISSNISMAANLYSTTGSCCA